MKKLFARKTLPVTFKRGGKLQGLGKNSGRRITGARGRRISIPRRRRG